MNNLKQTIDSKATYLRIGGFISKEGKKELEKDLVTLAKAIVDEHGIKENKLEYYVSTKSVMDDMLDYFEAEQDESLYEYLVAYGNENVAAMQEMKLEETEEGKEKAVSIEDEAVQLLQPLQRKVYNLAHYEGKMRNSSKYITEQLNYLDESQVLKLLIAIERNHILDLNMLKRSEESRGKKYGDS